MSNLNNKYRFIFSVTADQAKKDIDIYLKDLRSKKKTKTRNSPTQFKIEALQKIRDGLSVKQNTIAYKQVKKSLENIKSNINFRLKKNFKSSTRLERAVRDDRFSKISYIKTKETLQCGVGSFEVLDEYTLVYIQDPTDREEMFYTPPGGSYEGVDGWWVFHEYGGASQKDEFKSKGSRAWVLSAHVNNRSGTQYTSWMNKNKKIAYEAKPFLLRKSENPFPEDEQELASILRAISKEQLRRSKITQFGK